MVDKIEKGNTMNKWNYAVFDPTTKAATPIVMGKGTTIESVFAALKPNTLLIRIDKRNPKKKEKFVGTATARIWASL